jgi:threonine dehydrogenase-like Zn-dependent dehydrogenase
VRAVAVTQPHTLEIVDIAEPGRDGRPVVALDRMGLCGTDLSILRGNRPITYPRVLGHELVGQVVRTGERGLIAEGTRVIVNPAVDCGRCRECRADRANLCTNGGLVGRDIDGGFTELIAVDEDRLLPLPSGFPIESAVSLQVLGTCVHAQSTVRAFAGQTAAVIGLGVSGFLMVQLLRARGLQVMGVTRSSWKHTLGERLGAAAVAPPEHAARILGDLTGGAGADIVVEAAGTVETLGHAIGLAANGGHVVMFGTIAQRGPRVRTSVSEPEAGNPAELDFYKIYHKQLTLHGTRAALQRDYQRGIDLAVSGVIDLAPLYTHEFPLSRARDAFAALEGDARALKVALTPS